MATLALVGRPNTGKSTLFNRIVGGRVAITLREPGITRDRIVRTAEWDGRRFQVIDTGGLVPGTDDELSRLVGQQTEVALAEADVIVLVVDGQAGLVPLDEEVADRLRRAGRPFLLVVNKLDATRVFDPSEFHRLGGELLLPLSAEHGTGIDDLLDAVLERLPAESRTPERTDVALTILGRPNVGKSSFLNSLLGRARAIVTALPGTTRDTIEDVFTFGERNYRLIDTAGIRRRSRVSEAVEYFSVTRAVDTIDRCGVALLVVDATEGPTVQDKKIANLVEDRDKGLVVVANKMDLVPRDLVDKVRDYVARELSFVGYAPIAFVSALTGSGVTDAVRRAGGVWDAGGRQVSNSLLRAAVLPRLQGKPPGRNCRVLGLSQVGTRPPVFQLRVSDPPAVDARYRRFATAALRGFGFDGYPIRIRAVR